MHIVYAHEPVPTSVTKSIFLAGPTPRDKAVPSWRPEALRLLEEMGYDGHVFIPEPRNGAWSQHEYEDQIEWEEAFLAFSDVVVFWVPRDMKTMPALTTNIEWGRLEGSGRVVFGAPPEAASVRYIQHYVKKLKIPNSDTLQGTLAEAVRVIGTGALRQFGEVEVPLFVWNRVEFQTWYQTQRIAGNRLDGAKIVWAMCPRPGKWFLSALHVKVWVKEEERLKDNEVVIFRSDVSMAVLYYRDPNEEYFTKVVLVKEFRSPGRNRDGYIRELPGGSSKNPADDPLDVAVHEVEEEVGIKINPERFVSKGSRQLASTLSAHKAHLYAVELTEPEFTEIAAQVGKTFGVAEDTELTYVEIHTANDLPIRDNSVDWSTIGMIKSALS